MLRPQAPLAYGPGARSGRSEGGGRGRGELHGLVIKRRARVAEMALLEWCSAMQICGACTMCADMCSYGEAVMCSYVQLRSAVACRYFWDDFAGAMQCGAGTMCAGMCGHVVAIMCRYCWDDMPMQFMPRSAVQL